MKKIIITCLFLTGCITTAKVTRLNSAKVVDLSGRWNDTDARLVSEEMMDDLLGSFWLKKHIFDEHRPIVVVGEILNKTHEHIASDLFIKSMENNLVKMGQVRIVAYGIFRDQLEKEKSRQAGCLREAQQSCGKELGAGYMLFGVINSEVDTRESSGFFNKKEKLVFYQVNLELLDINTNEVVWTGEKKIKKIRK